MLTPDSIVPDPTNPQSLNRYSYGYNNPIKYVDPSGHVVELPCLYCDLDIDISGWSDLSVNAASVVCFFAGCHVDREGGSITGPTHQEWIDNSLVNLANPLAITGNSIVTYAGKSFVREHLDNVLMRGKKYAIEAAGNLVERLPGKVKQYDIIRYGAQSLRRGSGLEAHHGVMDAWFRGNKFSGYMTNNAPAMMLDPADHAKASQHYTEWAIERFGSTKNVDWTVVTRDEMMNLSKEMFDAAGVPQQAQENYYATFWHYINTITE